MVAEGSVGLHVWYVPLVAGACSGVAAWTAVYPADVLKARIVSVCAVLHEKQR